MRPRRKRRRRWLIVVLACVLVPAGSAGAALPKGDVVFLVDESGSMGPAIADVRAHINTIAAAASERLDARYALVAFGGAVPGVPPGEPRTRTAFTTPAGLSEALQGSGAFPGAGGGHELGLDATTYAMTRLTGFREGAGACAILISDEPPSFRIDEATDLHLAITALRARGAAWFGVVATGNEAVRRTYGPGPGSLAALSGGGTYPIGAFRQDPSLVLAGVTAHCAGAVVDADATNDRCTIRGTSGPDFLQGGPKRDVICGLQGDDVIVGAGWNDHLSGGRGNDVLRGNAGRDMLMGGAGSDLLRGGYQNDVLVGQRGGDRLHGGQGGDWLSGRAGRDRLWGQVGRDVLRGNAGPDGLWARDGWRDRVDGGSAHDVATLDAALDRARAVEAKAAPAG